MKKRIIISIIIAAVLFTGAFFYLSDYSRADENAVSMLESDDTVKVSQEEYGVFFDGPSDDIALVFYPGGKVEETAYAPLLHLLAAEGVDSCVLKMPFKLAFFDIDKAEEFTSKHNYKKVYLAGHSLGGVAAASYAAKNPDSADGLFLLASYPASKLDDNLETVFIYGSDDGVLDTEKLEKSRSFLPPDTAEHIIEGGNHAQFGSYGPQKHDGKASITPGEQVSETVDIILKSIKE